MTMIVPDICKSVRHTKNHTHHNITSNTRSAKKRESGDMINCHSWGSKCCCRTIALPWQSQCCWQWGPWTGGCSTCHMCPWRWGHWRQRCWSGRAPCRWRCRLAWPWRGGGACCRCCSRIIGIILYFYFC